MVKLILANYCPLQEVGIGMHIEWQGSASRWLTFFLHYYRETGITCTADTWILHRSCFRVQDTGRSSSSWGERLWAIRTSRITWILLPGNNFWNGSGKPVASLLAAHKNPRFVEDCVRQMAKKVLAEFEYLSGDSVVTIWQTNEESIHQHDAYAERTATIAERIDWMNWEKRNTGE